MKTIQLNVCIIEDDYIYNQLLSSYIKGLSSRLADKYITLRVFSFKTGEDFFKNNDCYPDIVFLDYYLDSETPEAETGLQIIKKLKAKYTKSNVISITTQNQSMIVAELMKQGAIDFIPKDNISFARVDLIIGNLVRLMRKKQRRSQRILEFTTIFIIMTILTLAYVNK